MLIDTRLACARTLFCLFACALTACTSPPKRVEIPVAVPCIKSLPAPVTLFTDRELAAWAAIVADTKRTQKDREQAAGNFVGAISLDRAALLRAVTARDGMLAACSKLS